MKNIFIALCFCIMGCVTSADVSKKPSGEVVLQSLLNVDAIDLSDEPLCDMKSVTMDKQNLLLRDHLATVLSTSFESENQTVLTSSCNESKHDLTKDELVEVWDCMLVINENSPKQEFISSSTIAFSLDKNNYQFIHKSLRCF